MSNYVETQAAKPRECLVLAKSKAAYIKAFEDFQEWKRKHLVNGINENILLAYFADLMKSCIALLFLFTTVQCYGFNMTETEFKKICGTEGWTELDFKNNQSDDYYKGKALHRCAISFSNIPNKILGDRIFRYLSKTKVKMMKVSNGLNTIYPHGFSLFNNMRYLSLAGNNLGQSEISNGYGKFCEVLEWVDLSNNKLKNASFLKSKSNYLKKINLDDNELEEYPLSNLKNFPNLVEISVCRNKIKKLHEKHWKGFDGEYTSTLGRVKYLDVSHNQLEDLEGLEYYPSVAYLNLSYNNVKALRGVYFQSETYSLKELNLDWNEIEVLNIEILLNMSSLQSLSLERNKLNRIIPFSTRQYWNTKLEYLNLGWNRLGDVPYNFFSYYPELKILKLNNNNIKILTEGIFANLKNLRSLDLSHNEITVLDVTKFIPLQSLEELDLEHNQIKSFDYISLASYLPNMNNLSFNLNPLYCDNLIEMLNFLKDTNIRVTKNGKCTYEEQIEGFCCSNKRSNKSSDDILEEKVNVAAAVIVRQNEQNFQKSEHFLEIMYNNTEELKKIFAADSNNYVTNFTFWTGVIIVVLVLCVFVFVQIFVVRNRLRKYRPVAM